MKRQIAVEYEEASPEVKEIYDVGMQVLGTDSVPNWMKALGNNPRILRATWEKFRFTVLEGDISQLLKQLILFNISVRAGNQYCTNVHGYSALNLEPDLTYEDLMSMSTGEAMSELPMSFQVAIETITNIAFLSDEEIAELDFISILLDAGFNQAEIDELLAQADFGVMMNKIVNLYDIPLETPFGKDVAI